ncbi:MAG: hypothetical protein A2X05_16475 [Bacteroidetes bacterium GWE2_41_25]|nr:MAG: hypothetical protein A2X03_19530 [Bacteroidetes bacterium GWA2_40_15]OFX84803.1 MAG: hypothetical protein A2X06_04455 [Bacteroidetes bacterium GWC2_40_22]OFY01697.1 MAG: hypothetical protein A2X05_16475 [Bacteroidetes bacterium GWE2_41_25]OFY57697.1 MAG: hypothetical protein A2X04_15965 [Bacteroidetes bacterium GWF2_41_9]HBQ81678.1 hypothetical protein [Bacteroidales bacterium]
MKKKNRSDKSINHPGRKRTLQYMNYHFSAATPPSKGGETYADLWIYNTTLKLTAMLPTPLGSADYVSDEL